MRGRRAFGLLVLALAAMLAGTLPSAAQAPTQDPFKIYVVLWRGVTEVERGFRDYLNERGIRHKLFVRNLDRDRSKAAGFIEEIREIEPDLVYTWGTSTTLSIVGPHTTETPEKFIRDIPAVFTLVAYPVEANIIESFERTGRNVTGTAFLAPLETQLKAIAEYRPIERVAQIYNPKERNSTINVAEMRETARRLGLSLIELPAPLGDDDKPLGSAIPDLVRVAKERGADALYMGPDSFLAVNADALTQAAIEQRLLTFAGTERPLRSSAAMMGLVSNYYTLGKLTASQAERILVDGTAPADLPVARLKRYSLIINMDVAKEIESYPPIQMLQFADVIAGRQ